MLAAFPMMIACEQFEHFIGTILKRGCRHNSGVCLSFTCVRAVSAVSIWPRTSVLVDMAGAVCKLVSDANAAPADLVRAVVSYQLAVDGVSPTLGPWTAAAHQQKL